MAVSFTKFNLFYKRHLQYAPIYKFISRTPPWFWGVLYLSIIPLFALIYHLKFTNDFYHSTLKYEHNYLAGESFYLNRGLINQIILNFEKLHSGKHDTIIDFNRIYIDKLAIYDNSADENEIVQSFLFQIFKIDSISKIEKFEKFGKMTVRLSKENISNWNENGKTMYLKLAFIEKNE
ncbi:MAG: hypothetical protein IPH94_16630 [Saprospiraceae bacterium]|nr:hypothetical protein [Saprospiraceae bacterium]